MIDAVRSWWNFIYQKFEEIFEENKRGIEGKSCTLTQFITFEEYTCMADKVGKGLGARPSRSLFTALYIICMTRIGRDSPNSKHFSKRMNEHFGLCSQWKSRCLETLMQLDATIDDVTATANQIYHISAWQSQAANQIYHISASQPQ